MDYADPKKKTVFCGKIIMVSALTALCILMLKQSPNFNTPSQFSSHEPGVTHVLVTGGAGYIGSHAALRLLKDSYRVTRVMGKYQEEGQLIEPYHEGMVPPLMAIVRTELGAFFTEILEVIKPICIIIYTLVTVCGYKSVIKFFPRQISELELAVSLLEKCHKMNVATSLR